MWHWLYSLTRILALSPSHHHHSRRQCNMLGSPLLLSVTQPTGSGFYCIFYYLSHYLDYRLYRHYRSFIAGRYMATRQTLSSALDINWDSHNIQVTLHCPWWWWWWWLAPVTTDARRDDDMVAKQWQFWDQNSSLLFVLANNFSFCPQSANF